MEDNKKVQENGKISLFGENEQPYMMIFLAMLSAIYLPYIAKTITLLIVRKPLASAVCMIFEMIGILVAMLFLMLAEKKYGLFEKKAYLAGILYAADAVLTGILFSERISGLLMARMLDKMPAYIILCFVVAAFMVFLFAMAFPTKGKFAVKYVFCFAAMILFEVTALFLNALVNSASPSFAAMSVYYILIAFVLASFLHFIFMRNKSMPVKVIGVKNYILPGVVMIPCLAGMIYFAIPTPIEDVIAADFFTGMQTASEQMANGNIDLALKTYKSMAEQRKCWYAICGEERYDQLDITNTDYAQIDLIGMEKQGKTGELKKYLTNGEYNFDLGKSYLLYSGKDLSEEEEQICKRVMEDMIALDSFSIDTITYKNIKKHEIEIRDELDKLTALDKLEAAITVVNRVEQYGLTEDDVTDMLDLAEKYETDLYIQNIAANYGSEYQADGASHYERTANAILRYKELYEKEYGEKETVTNDAWSRLYAIRQYDRLIENISKKENPSSAEKQYLALAYMKKNDYAGCIEAADRILRENAEDYNAYYYRAYCYCMDKKYDESLKNAAKLAERLKELDGADKQAAETELHLLIQYYTVSDGVFDACLKYPSKEQEKILKTSDVLVNYYYAANSGYNEKNTKKALEYIEALKAQIGEMPNVCYLEGNIYMIDDEFEKAVEAYQKSLSQTEDSVTGWYALANAYDALGDYEKAYQAALRASELLAGTDHENDPYGVAIHNNRLLMSLESKVKEK